MLKTLKRLPSGLINLKTKRRLTFFFLNIKAHHPPSLVWKLKCASPGESYPHHRHLHNPPTDPCNSAPCWSCHQNDCPMSNSHLDEQAFPVPQRKRMPVILPAQHPSLLPQPTMLPFSFEGATPAPFSVQVGNRLRPVRTMQSLGHCDWSRERLSMSSQPIRNNGHQSLDFCWNDGEGKHSVPWGCQVDRMEAWSHQGPSLLSQGKRTKKPTRRN